MWTTAGDLGDVELAHGGVSLGAREGELQHRSKVKAVSVRLSHHTEVLHVHKDQHPTGAPLVHRLRLASAADAGGRTHAQRAAAADEHGVAQHPMPSGEACGHTHTHR